MCRFHIFLVAILVITSGQFIRAEQRPIEFKDMFAMGRVANAQISPHGKWVAYQATYYNVEDNSKNADIYLVSTDGKQHKRLTFDPKMDTSPRWSPEGDRLAFISNREGTSQVYLLNLKGGEARQATDIPTGVNSFNWSPDGNYFAVATDVYPEAESPSESAEMEEERSKDLATGKVIDNLLYRHWNSWRNGKYSHLVVVPVEGGEAVDITPGANDTPPISLGSDHDYVWSPDGKKICFVKNPDEIIAASTNNDLWLVNPQGGDIAQLTESKANDNGPRFSPDGKYIAYLSMARPGFEADQENLIIYDRSNKRFKNLTAVLDRTVSDFVWGPESRQLYFYVPDHGRHQLFKVDRESGEREMLLERKYIGSIDISPDGKFLVIEHQATHLPTELFRFGLDDKTLTQLTFTNKERLTELEMNPVEEYFLNGANDDVIHMLMVKPPNFDFSKKYPLITLIHGGPQGAWRDNFHYRWNSQMFASPGYVVIMINFHGSRGYGQKFCDAVTHNWGGWPYQDIMIGTKWALERFDYIDSNRVGAAGASYGGFMINWIEGHNEEGLFKTLVSHDGVFEQVSMFGATEELWFPMWEFNGMPWEDGSLYHKWNPINFVENFNTPMLIIHGQKDYRVPYTQGLQLFTALQMSGVESRLLFFPDEDHFVTKPQNAQLWWQQVHGWLAKYLKPAGKAEK